MKGHRGTASQMPPDDIKTGRGRVFPIAMEARGRRDDKGFFFFNQTCLFHPHVRCHSLIFLVLGAKRER